MKKNLEMSLNEAINPYSSLKGIVDAHLDNNLREGQFLSGAYSNKEFEKNSELLNLYLKQKQIEKVSNSNMIIRANKLNNNIDKDETDYVLKISSKFKKKVLKEIFSINEDLRTDNKSLANQKHAEDSVKMVLVEKKLEEVKKRKQFDTAEINYRASFISKKLDAISSLELYKG